MRRAKEALEGALVRVGEAVYGAGAAGAGPGGGPGQGGPEGGRGPQEGTVEGEFREV
ncbi:MAG: hypothetical protein HY689_10360 [Chloroflexi bacterium]|nr:hypothetical protein [Chloroflexota bacterium]